MTIQRSYWYVANYRFKIIVIKFFAVVVAIFVLPHDAEGKCGELNMDSAVALQTIGERLIVRNAVIAGEISRGIEEAIRSSNVSTVDFECIPGGIGRDADRLMHAFTGLTVRVKGFCNSACAQLAFAAKKLILLDSKTDHPTSLVVHSSTPLTDKPIPNDYKLRNLNFYTVRFAGVFTREQIFNVLDSDPKLGLGLVIVRNGGRYFPSTNSFAYVCSRYPTNCLPVMESSLGEIKIYRDD